MTRKSSLAKGMFSTKISLAKGIWSKTGAAHPRHKFVWSFHHYPGRSTILQLLKVLDDWTCR